MNKQLLQQLASRSALSLNGFDFAGGLYRNPESATKVDVATETQQYWARALASLEDTDENRKARAESIQMIKDAWEQGPGSKPARSLNALRLETVNNYIRAKSNWMRFFNVVTLKADEIPGITNETMNEIRVGYIGEDGSPRHFKIEKPQDQKTFDLRVLSSARVGYRTRDIYKGNIAPVAQRTFDIGFDLNFKVDRVAYTMATALVAAGGPLGTFVTTGAKVNRLYLAHSGIDTSHLPTTNIINCYSTGTTYYGKFCTGVLTEILKYASSWADVWPDGPLVPTGEVVVPSSDVFGIFAELALASTTDKIPTQTELSRQITLNGWLGLRWGGIDWKFIPDITIPKNACYPVFNKKVGNFYLKPDMDEEFVNTDREKHYESRSQNKVVGCAVIDQWRANFAKFIYAS